MGFVYSWNKKTGWKNIKAAKQLKYNFSMRHLTSSRVLDVNYILPLKHISIMWANHKSI